MGRRSSLKRKTLSPVKTRAQKLKQATKLTPIGKNKAMAGSKLIIKRNKFSEEFKNKVKSKLDEWKRKRQQEEAAAQASPSNDSPIKLRRNRQKLKKKLTDSHQDALDIISTSIITPTIAKSPIISLTKVLARTITSNADQSLTAQPQRPNANCKDNHDGDSDIEIIETNITVIDLDETSNDMFGDCDANANEQNIPKSIVPVAALPELSVESQTSSTSSAINATMVTNSSNVSQALTKVTPCMTSTPMSSERPVSQAEYSPSSPPPSSTPTPTTTSEILPASVAATPSQTVHIVEESPEPTPHAELFYKDVRGTVADSLHHVPLYEPISDDSFCSMENATPVKNRSSMPTIDLDDISFDKHIMPSPKVRRTKRSNRDDSVIFVSETLCSAAQADSFIPLPNCPAEKRPRNYRHKASKPMRKQFTNSASTKYSPTRAVVPRAAVPAAIPIGNNSYNPRKEKTTKDSKRMIIIDGSNVAFGHSMNNMFSVRGIVICIEFFEREGHEVKAVLPQMRVKQRMSSDPSRLEDLHREGKVILTPCKNLPGKNVTSYDDRFIMDMAVEFDAAIISNDNYRDLVLENDNYRNIIESRVIGYTWCKDMILFPKDPYGRDGPTLDEILNRKERGDNATKRL